MQTWDKRNLFWDVGMNDANDKCGRLGELTEEELKSLVETADDETLADEAGRAFWDKVIQRRGGIDDDVLKELLSLRQYSSARALIGEAAMRDELTDQQLEQSERRLHEKEWAHRQVRGRRLVREFIADDDPATRWGRIEALMVLKLAWGIEELLPRMTADELERLYNICLTEKILSKRTRHTIRLAIKRRLAK